MEGCVCKMMRKFWAERLEEAIKNRELGLKPMSNWKLLNLVILKYQFPLEIRGISAMEASLKLIKNKDDFDKLNDKEKEIVSKMICE